MFTTKGKSLVARKLGGISDSCFDYLSIGIGGKPLAPNLNVHQSGPLTAMKHEIMRVPVIATLPTQSGTVKCVAEIPAHLTCEFTEVGLWTHRNNSASARPASKSIVVFEDTETWKDGSSGAGMSEIRSTAGQTDYTEHDAYIASTGYPSMFSPYDDYLWIGRPVRRVRKEGFRLGRQGVLIRGNMSTLTGTYPPFTTGSNYISIPLAGLPFDTSSPLDELGIAYFISTKSGASTTAPDAIRLSIQFVTADGKTAKWDLERKTETLASVVHTTGSAAITYTANPLLRKGDQLSGTGLAATAEVYPTSSTAAYMTDVSNGSATNSMSINAFSLAASSSGNAYYTDYIGLGETASNNRTMMTYSSGFKWENVVTLNIYGAAIVSGSPSSNYYIGLDSINFTNVDDLNPGYGLVAYDVAYNYETRGVQTRQGSPIDVLFEVQLV